jgi:hypothetical protein
MGGGNPRSRALDDTHTPCPCSQVGPTKVEGGRGRVALKSAMRLLVAFTTAVITKGSDTLPTGADMMVYGFENPLYLLPQQRRHR